MADRTPADRAASWLAQPDNRSRLKSKAFPIAVATFFVAGTIFFTFTPLGIAISVWIGQ